MQDVQKPIARRAAVSLWRQWEGPTWLVIAGVYGGWLLLTAYAAQLPWFLVLPLGGFVLCLHSSMQHELIHGHPTRNQRINALLGWPPLSLWLPFAAYRDSHIEHHRSEYLTRPERDPESFYVAAESWADSGWLRRAVLVVNNTLLGRLLIGPYLLIGRLWWSEWGGRQRGDRRIWIEHGIGMAAVLVWVNAVCDIPLWRYWLLFVWPGTALLLLRSFYEHRPAASQALRTGVVETNILFRLLFLNNNYHTLHHERPGVPWYDLHRCYWVQRDALLARNGGYVIPGYGDLMRRYGLFAKDFPVHPEADSAVRLTPQPAPAGAAAT